ncbi:MAG: hypothetical protein J6569_04955 [Gilliamella sp.]|uniref:hypothetical protein n=1 Tax=Gilliamella sp. TaxID=1891236 RepID=UPI0025EC2FF9|nr:hypothetical protein [Gilliamella sp.]MCO6538313.1 hypothetical protein [Gilliamella sp.]MCO6539469.1 hypothetical protein [Gilliamella sp.]
MDFTSDSSQNQCCFRKFNLIDGFSRAALGIDIMLSLLTGRITRYLDKLAQYHCYSLKIWNYSGSFLPTEQNYTVLPLIILSQVVYIKTVILNDLTELIESNC